MKELVEVIAKALVEHPDKVVATETKEGKNVRISLKVAPSDMGKVIGKQGRIAKSIRSVVKAAASLQDLRVDVDIDSLDDAPADAAAAEEMSAAPEESTEAGEPAAEEEESAGEDSGADEE